MPWLQNRTIDSIRELVQSYSRWESGVIGCGFILGGLILVLPLNYQTAQANRVLSTLATTQASVLAIVFSVSILGVQLVATRYSARMMTLITSSTAFHGTLLLLFVSIGYDLLLLLQLPVLTAQDAIAGLAIAAGLAISSGFALTRYVRTTLELSSPEGLLSAYADDITLESYRSAVIESRETVGAFHPMHELNKSPGQRCCDILVLPK